MLVTRIEDAYGNELATFVPEMKEIFSESTSYKMLDMLKAVSMAVREADCAESII